ncbi:glycine zipper 2TM domain-containing protein [Undibacterium sp. Jales W-56]|uniref:glycine zipper 2TM domain-containing protein n=1 Tax=Undibacterium sp. Jales W-56 TaxID=2897325 RepID=UPI0021D32DA3|nr:glycine zipper 2TM domain-containing protein [Undibacterium sp. Jales W-56]MCU6433871.1 glycine zipper 2TM domain-containing protein [Undibacterium sp. Jales W-56]
MNSIPSNFPKAKLHPMILVAGAAVILFCAIGIAAIMGWIPTSIGGNLGNNASLSATDQMTVQAVTSTQVPPLKRHEGATASTMPLHQNLHNADANANTSDNGSAKTICGYCGIVESSRDITNRAAGSGIGAAGGAVVGGLLGNQVGGGHGQEAMTVIGAIGGAVAGNQIEGQVNATHSTEITIRMNDGSKRTLTQAGTSAWRSGDRVKIVNGVLRANG